MITRYCDTLLCIMKNKFYLFFGIWLIILPVLGFSDDIKSYFIFFSGIILFSVSIWEYLVAWLKLKPKSKKKIVKNIKNKEELHIEPIERGSVFDK